MKPQSDFSSLVELNKINMHVPIILNSMYYHFITIHIADFSLIEPNTINIHKTIYKSITLNCLILCYIMGFTEYKFCYLKTKEFLASSLVT